MVEVVAESVGGTCAREVAAVLFARFVGHEVCHIGLGGITPSAKCLCHVY